MNKITDPQYADVVTDKIYDVTAYPSHDGDIKLGEYEYGQEVVRIQFYTGFAGCPSRYHVTKIDNGRRSTYLRYA